MVQGTAVQPRPDEILALVQQAFASAESGELTAGVRTRLQAEVAKRSFPSVSIKLNGELFDSIRASKAALGTGKDFDPSLDEAEP